MASVASVRVVQVNPAHVEVFKTLQRVADGAYCGMFNINNTLDKEEAVFIIVSRDGISLLYWVDFYGNWWLSGHVCPHHEDRVARFKTEIGVKDYGACEVEETKKSMSSLLEKATGGISSYCSVTIASILNTSIDLVDDKFIGALEKSLNGTPHVFSLAILLYLALNEFKGISELLGKTRGRIAKGSSFKDLSRRYISRGLNAINGKVP